MENLIKKGRRFNPVSVPTELYKKEKVYVMDNHLLAPWCWLQEIDLGEKYNFFHIDRHFDLLQNTVDRGLRLLDEKKIDLLTINIDEFLDINKVHTIITHDNYILIFDKLYGNLLDKIFYTHNDGTIPEKWQEGYHAHFYELFDNLEYWINKEKESFIVNIDMDYFIRKYDDDQCLQIFSDDYLKMIGVEIRNCYDKISVITIALTPTFCCNIETSKRLANIIISNIFKEDIKI